MNAFVYVGAVAWLALATPLAASSQQPCSFNGLRIDPYDPIYFYGECGLNDPEVKLYTKDEDGIQRRILSIKFSEGFEVKRSEANQQRPVVCGIEIPLEYQDNCTFAPSSTLLQGYADILHAHYGDVELGFGHTDGPTGAMQYASTKKIRKGTNAFQLKIEPQHDERVWLPCTGRGTLKYSIKLELYTREGEKPGHGESSLGVGDTSQNLLNTSYWAMRKC